MTTFYNRLTDNDDTNDRNPWADPQLLADALQHWGFDTDEELRAMELRTEKAIYDYVREVGEDNVSVIWMDHLSRSYYYAALVLQHRAKARLRARIAARRAEALAAIEGI